MADTTRFPKVLTRHGAKLWSPSRRRPVVSPPCRRSPAAVPAGPRIRGGGLSPTFPTSTLARSGPAEPACPALESGHSGEAPLADGGAREEAETGTGRPASLQDWHTVSSWVRHPRLSWAPKARLARLRPASMAPMVLVGGACQSGTSVAWTDVRASQQGRGRSHGDNRRIVEGSGSWWGLRCRRCSA
jgi:hypothetical protein